MPTEVPIRGQKSQAKKARDRRKWKARKAEARRLEQAKERHSSNAHEPKLGRPSMLDRLPPETLQQIFCYGTNFSLPLVSRGIHQKLSGNDLIKERIAIQLLWGADEKGFYRQGLAAMQSALLNKKWFDLTFLRRCTLRVQFAHLWEDLEAVGLADPRAARLKYDHFVDGLSRSIGDECCYSADGLEFKKLNGKTASIEFELRDGVSLVETGKPEQVDGVGIYDEPCLHEDCMLPKRLFQAPWSKANAVLLREILDMFYKCLGNDRLLDHVRRMMQPGLAAAIKTHCPQMVVAMIGGEEERECSKTTLTWKMPDGPLLKDKQLAEDPLDKGTWDLDQLAEDILTQSWTHQYRDDYKASVTREHIELCLVHATGSFEDRQIMALLIQKYKDEDGNLLDVEEALEFCQDLTRHAERSAGRKAKFIWKLVEIFGIGLQPECDDDSD